MRAERSLPFLLLAVLLAAAAGAETQVFNSYLYPGDTFVIDKTVLVVYLDASEKSITADYGGKSMVVQNNSCESTDYFKVCLDNVEQDYKLKKKKMAVRAFSNTPSMTITRTVAKSELIVGEETAFTVSVSNSGGIARAAAYTEEFPDYVKVYDVEGAKLVGNSVVWQGVLGQSASREFTYRIKPKKPFKQSFKASFSYFDGYVKKTVYSSDITVNVEHFLKFETKIGRAEAYIGQPNNITINFTNRGNNSVNATVELFFDTSYNVTSVPRAFDRVDKNVYRWSGELRGRNLSNTRYFSKWFTFEMEGSKIGTFDITVAVRYDDLVDLYSLALPDVRKSVKLTDKGFLFRSSLKDKAIESGQKHTLKVWLQNPNAYVDIRDVKVSTFSDFGYVPDVYLPVMEAGRQKLVIERDFYAPNVSSSSGYRVMVNVSYSLAGKIESREFKDTATVQPVADLAISQSATKSSLSSGEESFITVTVRNPRTTGINLVKVHDAVPDSLEVYGLTSVVMSIPKGGTENAYTYRLVAPRVSNETVFRIRTDAEYSDSNNEFVYSPILSYGVSKEQSITVTPEKFPLTVTRAMRDSEIVKSSAHYVDYSISNPSDRLIARDVSLSYPLAPEYDLIDSTEQRLADVGPGEKAQFAGERIRFKVNSSYTVPYATLNYKSQFGDSYATNISTIGLTVKESPLDGPALVLSKSAPRSVNSTDTIPVELKITNSGSEMAVADVSDGEVKFAAYVQPGSSLSYNYTQFVTQPGNRDMTAAVATYTYRNRTYITSSNVRKVEVVDKPLLTVTKTAPARADTAGQFPVTVTVKSVSNITLDVNLTDGPRSWKLSSFLGENNYSYNISFDKPGVATLPAAIGSFVHNNRTFLSSSSAPEVDVSEKAAVKVSKTVSNSSVRQGQKIRVMIRLRSQVDEPLNVSLADPGGKWDFLLAPGAEKEAEYELTVNDGHLAPSVASYSYKGRQMSSSSEKVSLDLVNATLEEAGGSQAGESIFKRIINSITNVLKWKRSS